MVFYFSVHLTAVSILSLARLAALRAAEVSSDGDYDGRHVNNEVIIHDEAKYVLTIASVEMEPYLMKNPYYEHANDSSARVEYIGFIADLVDKLSHVIGFDYVIRPVADQSFGHLNEDSSWDGIVGELISRRAHLAAAPMYSTAQRAHVIDFTEPFMALYATILMRRHIATSPAGPPITSLKDLVRQSNLRYGTLNRGVLVRAFRQTNVTTYRSAWHHMTRFQPSVFTTSNQEGIERVRSSGYRYAFIVPHPIGDYVASRDPCDLVTVGRFLPHRGYSLAVPRNPLVNRSTLNAALRGLIDAGFIQQLYRKWWTFESRCAPMSTTGANANSITGPKREASVAAVYGDGNIDDVDDDSVFAAVSGSASCDYRCVSITVVVVSYAVSVIFTTII